MGGQLVELAPGFPYYVGGEEEGRFIYKEIFEDDTYDVAKLPENAFIIDVGANIGLFSTYMKQKYPLSNITAFEPAPETFATLSKNMELYKFAGVETHQCALGSKETTQALTFYPNFPGNSTLVPEEKANLKRICYENGIGELVERVFSGAEEINVPIKRLSHFLQDRADLTSIDLLKIDVEGSELEVLEGLDEAHWPLVQNIVIEICNLRGELSELERLLGSKGFVVKKELAEFAPEETQIYTVTARRGHN